MKDDSHDGLPVTGTGNSTLGTRQADEKPMAVLDQPQTTFVRRLAAKLGVTETCVLDYIVAAYQERFDDLSCDCDACEEESEEAPTGEV